MNNWGMISDIYGMATDSMGKPDSNKKNCMRKFRLIPFDSMDARIYGLIGFG
jgi:hypothetical protein